MKLSIITINFNNLEGLKRTSESVLSQTWRDFEWIIIDGGSTDGSKDYVEALTNNPNTNLSFWCSEPDNGIYNALNKGIQHANGKYICCMNSGDCFFEKETLERVSAKECDADIIYGGSLEEYVNVSVEKYFKFPFNVGDLWDGNICHQAMFVRTELLKERGFDESYKIAADYARWVEMFFEGRSFHRQNFLICKYDGTGISVTAEEQHAIERRRVHEEAFPSYVRDYIKEEEDFRTSYYVSHAEYIEKRGGFKRWVLHSLFQVFDFIGNLKK